MKIEIKKITGNIAQITTLDERWYQIKEGKGDVFYPSSSWISSYYPKGIEYHKWLARNGWDESIAIRDERAKQGSKVHSAIESLLSGKTVRMDDKFLNNNTEDDEELTVREWEYVMSFYSFYKALSEDYNITTNKVEHTIVNKKYKYAGTLDWDVTITPKKADMKKPIYKGRWIIDFKTSAYIWDSHRIQISSYRHADDYANVDVKAAILQLGYTKNKAGWKLTVIDDKFKLFLHAKAIWANENPDAKPKQKDYPVEITLKTKSQNNDRNTKSTNAKNVSGRKVQRKSSQSSRSKK